MGWAVLLLLVGLVPAYLLVAVLAGGWLYWKRRAGDAEAALAWRAVWDRSRPMPGVTDGEGI